MKTSTPKQIAEKNIRAILDREDQELAKVPFHHRWANAAAAFAGTVAFLVIHLLIFAAWFTVNTATSIRFDPYPFTLLITIVSLESIFLSTLVLISQNSMAAMTDRRHALDLQINLLAEQESTALIKVVLDMAEKMGIPEEKLSELRNLAEDTKPEDVLQQITEIESEKK